MEVSEKIIESSSVIANENAFKLHLIDNNILHFEYFDNQLIKLSDVQRAYELYEEQSVNYDLKVLLSFGPFASITGDARKFSESVEMPTPAQAIILENLSQRILARFYGLFRKDTHPLRFFSEPQSAIQWLNQINSDNGMVNF